MAKVSKVKGIRKVYWEDLPTFNCSEGMPIKTDWSKCISKHVEFEFDGIKGSIKILDVFKVTTGTKLILKYKDIISVTGTSEFKKARLSNVLGIRRKGRIYNVGQTVNRFTILKYVIKTEPVWEIENKLYIVRCNGCGHVYEKDETSIKDNSCCYCYGKRTIRGVNDIATTNPRIAKLIRDKDNSFKYMEGSGKKIFFKCPDCGHEKKNTIRKVVAWGHMACPRCSDGISMPNKFLRNILFQLRDIFEIEVDFEKVFGDYPRRYDGYLKINNISYTIEAHGKQHYEGLIYDTTSEKQSKIDEEKRKFSESIGNIHIEVDCRDSNFTYLKESFTNELSRIIDMSVIDWDSIYLKASRSIVYDICKMYDEENVNIVHDISKAMKITTPTVRKYLRMGNDLNICNYL